MKFWCYNDVGLHWGEGLYNAARDRGHDAFMFENPRLCDNGVAFVHMHHHPELRGLHKRAMETLSINPDLNLVPRYRLAKLFDDKLEQLRELAKYMPHTVVYHTHGRAREHLEQKKSPTLPFISKSREGTSGHNVRLVKEYTDANSEIQAAFSDRGIRQRHGLNQRSYLMWQRMIPDITHDIRIVRVGTQRLVLRRFKDRGKFKIDAIAKIDDEIADALWYADAFFRNQADLEWCAVDLIRDPEKGRWFVLEVTASWNLVGFAEARFIRGDVVTDKTGADIWPALIEEVERGSFGEVK